MSQNIANNTHLLQANIPDDEEQSSSSDEEEFLEEPPHPSDSDDEQGDGNLPPTAVTDANGNPLLTTTGGGGGSGSNKAHGSSKASGKGDVGEYDYTDDFIDDSEHITMFEKTDKRKPKYLGFFIALGSIDRSEELVANAVPDAPQQRKKQQQGLQAGKNDGEAMQKEEKKSDTAGSGGGEKKRKKSDAVDGTAGDEEKQKKSKKKKKTADVTPGTVAAGTPAATQQQQGSKGASLAQLAAAAGAGITASTPVPGPRPPVSSLLAPELTPLKEGPSHHHHHHQKDSNLPTYILPDDVSETIAAIRVLAAEAPQPAASEPGKPVRKMLPSAVLKKLRESEELFQREYATYKNTAANAILGELMSFLGPFTKRENLRLYVCGRVRCFVRVLLFYIDIGCLVGAIWRGVCLF